MDGAKFTTVLEKQMRQGITMPDIFRHKYFPELHQFCNLNALVLSEIVLYINMTISGAKILC